MVWSHLEHRTSWHLPVDGERTPVCRREESAPEVPCRPASSALVQETCHLSAGPTAVLPGRESRTAVIHFGTFFRAITGCSPNN